MQSNCFVPLPKKLFKCAIAQLKIHSGIIFRVKVKFALNYYWNLYFFYANSVSLMHIYGTFNVTLVPD